MTRATTLSKNRRFEMKKGEVVPVRREKVIDPFIKKIGMCFICDTPVFTSIGQLLTKNKRGLYSHKACRKN